MNERVFGVDTSSLTLRGASVAVLVLLMLIPVGMVRGVIDERNALYQGVVQQVGAEWGGEQLVIGPVLPIPVTERTSRDGRPRDGDGVIDGNPATSPRLPRRCASMTPMHGVSVASTKR
jgi:hypothetical protein